MLLDGHVFSHTTHCLVQPWYLTLMASSVLYRALIARVMRRPASSLHPTSPRVSDSQVHEPTNTVLRTPTKSRCNASQHIQQTRSYRIHPSVSCRHPRPSSGRLATVNVSHCPAVTCPRRSRLTRTRHSRRLETASVLRAAFVKQIDGSRSARH